MAETPGIANTSPSTGIDRTALSANGKKFANKLTNPKPSKHMPSSGRLKKTTRITPPKKQPTPRKPESYAFFTKKR